MSTPSSQNDRDRDGPRAGRTWPQGSPPGDGDRTFGERRRRAEQLAEQLTPRQREVLALLLRGDSTKEIATALGIKQDTAREHVQVLYTHFSVSSRGELMAMFVPTWY